eukprot:1340481-Rhodomonas_salina.2
MARDHRGVSLGVCNQRAVWSVCMKVRMGCGGSRRWKGHTLCREAEWTAARILMARTSAERRILSRTAPLPLIQDGECVQLACLVRVGARSIEVDRRVCVGALIGAWNWDSRLGLPATTFGQVRMCQGRVVYMYQFGRCPEKRLVGVPNVARCSRCGRVEATASAPRGEGCRGIERRHWATGN